MDTSIDFRFVTRTFSEDYRILCDGGEFELDNSEFEPLREKCGIIPELGAEAALFEEGGQIFLVVSGLNRNGRPGNKILVLSDFQEQRDGRGVLFIQACNS